MKLISTKSKAQMIKRIQQLYQTLSLLDIEIVKGKLGKSRDLINDCLINIESIVLEIGDVRDVSKLLVSTSKFLQSKDPKVVDLCLESIDVQDIVRCKNCKQFKCVESNIHELSFDGFCMKNWEPRAHKFDDFCNYGEEINNDK